MFCASCFFCKYINASSFNWNKSYRIFKIFEKQAVEPSVPSLLNNVGPTSLGPFEQAFRGLGAIVMFHAFFYLESEPDHHPNKMLLRPCVCAGGNFYGFAESWRNNFRTKHYIIFSGLNIFGIEDLNTSEV